MKHSTRHTSNSNTTARSGVGGQSRPRRPTLRHTRLHTHGRRSHTSRTSTHSHHHSTATPNNSSGGTSSNTSSTTEEAASKLRTNTTHTTSAILSLHTNTAVSSGTSSLDEQDGEEGSGSSGSSSEDDMRRIHHHYHHYHNHRSHTTSSRSVTRSVSTSASDASSERSTHTSASARTEEMDVCPYGTAEYYSMNEYDDEENDEEEEEHIVCVLYRLPRALFLHVCSFLEDKECRVVLELSRTLHAQITSADSIVWRALCLQAWSDKQGFRDFVIACQARRQYTVCNEEIRLFALQQRLLVQYYADNHVGFTELYADLQECEGENDAVQQAEQDNNNNTLSITEAVRNVAEAIDTEHTAATLSVQPPSTPVAARKSVTIVTHQHSQSTNSNSEDVCEEDGSTLVCAQHGSHVLADSYNAHAPLSHMSVYTGDGGHVARSRSRPRRSRRRRRRRCPKSRGRSQGRSTTITTYHMNNSNNNSSKRGSSSGHPHHHHTRARHRSSRRRGQTCKRPPPASGQRRRRRRRRGRGRHWTGGQKARTQRAASHTRHSGHHPHRFCYNDDISDSTSSSNCGEEDARYGRTRHYQPHRTRTYSSNKTMDRGEYTNTTIAAATVHHYYPHRSRSRTHRPANPRKPSQSARRRRRRQAQQRNHNNNNHQHQRVRTNSKKKYAACCQVHTATYEAIQRTTVHERTARQLPPCPVRTHGVGPGQVGQSTLHWWQLAPETRQELLLQRLQVEQEEKEKNEDEEDVVSQLSASAMDADDKNEQPLHSHTRSKASSHASSSSHHTSTAADDDDGDDGVVSRTQRVMCLRETAMRVTQAASLQLFHKNTSSNASCTVQDSAQATEAHSKDEADVKDASTAPLLTLPPMSWKFAYYMARREAKRTRLSIQDLLDGVWLVCFRATGNVHPIYFHSDQSLVIDHALFTFAADAEGRTGSSNDEDDEQLERTDMRVPTTLPTRTRVFVQPTGNTSEGARVSEAAPLSQGERHVITSSSSSSGVLVAETLHEQYTNNNGGAGGSGAAPPPTASVRSLDDGSHQFAQRPTTAAFFPPSTTSATATAAPFTSAQLMHEHTPPPTTTTTITNTTADSTRAAPAPLPSLRYHLVQGGAQLVVHNFPSLQVLRRNCASQTEESSAERAEPPVSTSSSPSTQPLPSSLLDRVFAEEPQRSLRLLYGEAHTTSTATAAPASTSADTVQVHGDSMRDVVQRLKARGGLHVGLSAQRTHKSNNRNKCTSTTSPHSAVGDAAQVSARIGTDWGWTLSSNFVKIFSVELHTPLFVERLGRIAGLAEGDAE